VALSTSSISAILDGEIPSGCPSRVRLGLDIAARERPHPPGAGAEAGRLLELADLAVLGLPGAKVHCTWGAEPNGTFEHPTESFVQV